MTKAKQSQTKTVGKWIGKRALTAAETQWLLNGAQGLSYENPKQTQK